MSISHLIPFQLPQFVQEQYPEFCQFLKYYYEYLEDVYNPVFKIDKILDEINLDSASEESLNHFINYIGKYLPAEFIGDKTLLLKHIKEFYLSRGTEESYRFMMTMMFGPESGNKTKLEYPIDKTLHLSAGEWNEKKSLKLAFVDVPLSLFSNTKIVDENGVEAWIENAFSYLIGETRIIEIFLQNSSISGEFSIGPAEIVELGLNVEILPVISRINIISSGSEYTSYDRVEFRTDYSDFDLFIDTVSDSYDVNDLIETIETSSNSENSINQETEINRPVKSLTPITGMRNQIFNSNIISLPLWDESSVSVEVFNDIIEDYDTAPDGSETATYLRVPDEFAILEYQEEIPIVAGKTYTFSIFLKDVDGDNITSRPVQIETQNFVASGAPFDILNGIVDITGINGTAGIIPVGNGWYRCWITGNAITSSADFPASKLDIVLVSLAGGSQEWLVWGAQFEEGNLTPYQSVINSDNYVHITEENVDLFGSIQFDGNNTFLKTSFDGNSSGGFGASFFVELLENKDQTFFRNSYVDTYNFSLSIKENGIVEFKIGFDNDNWISVESVANVLTSRERAIISVQYDGELTPDSLRIYKNGILLNVTGDNDGTFTEPGLGESIRIGEDLYGNIGDFIYWQGYVLSDEIVRIISLELYKKWIDPSTTIEFSWGQGAIFRISDLVGGEIYKIDTIQSGIGYAENFNQILTVNSNTGNEFFGNIISGALTNYPGYYISNKNLISEESVRLHDNNFYQQFSYLISSPIALNNYEAQLLDAIHPAGRKLFGKFQFEEMIEFISTGELDGQINATLFSETDGSQSIEFEPISLKVQTNPISIFQMSEQQLEFLTMRIFYPHEFVSGDMYFIDPQYYGGSFNYSDRSIYFGGNSNTSSETIANSVLTDLQPDPVLYRFPFIKNKAKLWITGNSKVTKKDHVVEFDGELTSIKYKVINSQKFNFGTSDFGIKFDFIPNTAEDKALIALSGSGYFDEGGLESTIWGGSGETDTLWPAASTSRAWGIGINAANRIYVNLFSPTDDIAEVDGINTYIHTKELDLNVEHSVFVTFNAIGQTLTIIVDGIKETFSHTVGINTSTAPLTIGGTYHQNINGESHTFSGIIKNIAIFNRKLEDEEFNDLNGKKYEELIAPQKHAMIFFTNMSIPGPIDLTDYNANIEFYVPVSVINPVSSVILDDRFYVSSTPKYGLNTIADQTFWNKKYHPTISNSSVEILNSFSSGLNSFENLILQSSNLISSSFVNIDPQIDEFSLNITLEDNSAGSPQTHDIILDSYIIENGDYVLEFLSESDFKSELGNIKGFQIIVNDTIKAHFYKIGETYHQNNTEYTILPNDIIKIKFYLNDLTKPINNEFELKIRMLSTDSTSVYSTFVPNLINSLKLENFHLYNAENVSNYIYTKEIPILSGVLPSFVFNNESSYIYETAELNIDNKAIFCVCTNSGVILNHPDFILETNKFEISTESLSITDASSNRKLIRAMHLDGVYSVFLKEQNEESESDEDFLVNIEADADVEEINLFQSDKKLRIYELIVLDNPSEKEIDSTTQYLISKYKL